MKRGLGEIERRLFAYAHMRDRPTLRTGDLVAPLKLTVPSERRLLSRLARAGWIVRVWRGLYLVPPRLPLGGKWSPSEALALNTLMEDRRGRFQVCGLNAFNRYGFDEQVPARVHAYNDRISGQRRIGAVALSLIKVAPSRLGSTEKAETADGETILYSSRARTLVDAVYDWSRFGSLPRAFGWIRSELAARRVDVAELVRLTLRYGDVGTVRRIAALLDRQGASPQLLRRLERSLTPSTSLIPWIPNRPKRGKIDRRWGIVWNDRA